MLASNGWIEPDLAAFSQESRRGQGYKRLDMRKDWLAQYELLTFAKPLGLLDYFH